MRRLRLSTTATLICIMALLVGGCASSPWAGASSDATTQPSTDPTSASSVTITFGADSFMRHAYEPLIDAFNAQHPGITVQFVSLDAVYQGRYDDHEQVRQIVGRADTADAAANEAEFRQGLLRDLKPLMDADAAFDRDDFYPSALNSATTADSAVYKLPRALDIRLLYYNKDLWAMHGMAAPKPDWTWQDLAAAAQQLAQKQGSTVTTYGLADEAAYLGVLLDELRGAGLDLFTAPPASVRVDRPEVAAALERMANRFTSGAFYFPPQGSDFRDTVGQMIDEQKVAIWGSYASRDSLKLQPSDGSNTAAGPAIGVALHPPFPGSQDFSSGYIMSNGTQHPDEAWIWLSFLSKQLVAGESGKGGPPGSVSQLPARMSLAAQSGYWSRLDEQTRSAVQALLARPASAPSTLNNLEAYEPLLQAIQDIMDGKSADQAASEAQAAIAERVAQIQQTPTVTVNEPVVVATPAPNVAPEGATTITFGMPMGKGGDGANRVVQQFNQSNQGVFVQLKDTFTGNDFLSATAAAAQFDCFAAPFPPASSELTATLDLQPLIDADPSFTLDDYPAALLTPYRQGEQLRGLPWGVEFRVLVYNKNLFDAAGLAPPVASWTFDDLVNAAQRLTSGEGADKQYGFVIPRATSEGAKFLLHLLGAPLTQGSGDALKPNFTDPNVVQAVQRVVNLLKNDTPHTRLDDYAQVGRLADYGELTGEGRAGFWFAWGLYAYGRDPEFPIAMAAPPLSQAIFDTDDISTSGMYISANTDKQQACWEWLKYLSTTTIQGVSIVPARRSAAQSDAINATQPGMAAVYNAYAAALDRAGQLAPGSASPDTPPIDYYWLYQAIDQALQGKNLEQELSQAQALTELYIACVWAGDQREACNRQVDPNYGSN
jgi:ABC-type glycerol-3-phosphate transport system substrate-binding protein